MPTTIMSRQEAIDHLQSEGGPTPMDLEAIATLIDTTRPYTFSDIGKDNVLMSDNAYTMNARLALLFREMAAGRSVS